MWLEYYIEADAKDEDEVENNSGDVSSTQPVVPSLLLHPHLHWSRQSLRLVNIDLDFTLDLQSLWVNPQF